MFPDVVPRAIYVTQVPKMSLLVPYRSLQNHSIPESFHPIVKLNLELLV